MKMTSRAALVGTVLAGLAGCKEAPPAQKTPTEACAALAGRTFGDATVSSASVVAATAMVPEHCKLAGSMRTTLRFEALLPTAWNHKLLYLGGGGWDGSVPNLYQSYSPSGNTGGYVVVGSNGGHDDPTGAAFLNNPQVQKDFGYLGIHSVLEVVKQIVKERYGEAPQRHYFEGCSNGGREALIQASRYPQDFDGIVSRAPAYSFTELTMAFLNNMKRMQGTPGGAISAAKANTIAKAALQKCDALDGLSDLLISNVEGCTFDPGTLLCSASDSDSCLTPEQVTTAQAIYSEYKLASGTSVYPGWGPGGEEQGWLDWLIGRSPTPALQLFFADSMIRYWLVKNPAYSSLTFDPQSSTSQAQLAEAAQILDASPDLSGFFARSGKLILIHGDADWAISYRGSVKYFNNVATAVGGAARRDESMEFFLEPGVQHCFGGTGPDSIDLLDAVAGWVEQGRRPSSAGLLLSKQDATGKVAFTRPLCRYPQYPRYKGTGDILAAASYTCTSP